MRLSQPVYDNGYVALADLPYPGETMPNGFTCYITGWGLIDCKKTLMITYMSHAHIYRCLIKHSCTTPFLPLFTVYGTVPAILQEAAIPVVAHSVCSQPNWWGSLAKETMVCAGGDGVISGCQVQ